MDDIASVVTSSFERAPWGYGLLLAVMTALIKGWPAISDAATRARDALTNQRRTDMEDMRERIISLEGKVEKATAVAGRAQMQMTYVTAALGMVSAELERKDPGNPVLKQARDLVAQATYDAEPFGAMVAKMDAIKGTGE